MVARAGTRTTGLGRYVFSLYDAFEAAGRPVYLAMPEPPPLPSYFYKLIARNGIDLHTFFLNYPVRAGLNGAAICHITSQNLATLLRLQRMPPTIVTVHDLYFPPEHTRSRNFTTFEHWFDRLAISGIMQAKEIIAISEYTKRTIVDRLHYPEERIRVIYRAVDTSVFKPLAVSGEFRAKYGLPQEALLVLYVGSEDPRKNLTTLIEAFSQVSASIPNAILVKAGSVHFHQEAARIRQRVEDLGIKSKVRFIEDLPDDDLPLLYNIADVFVLPSLLEGFGLPALEAMACGKPVIAANASSLPEVVGEAGLLFDPRSADELAAALIHLLKDADLRLKLGQMATTRARTFSLAQQASQTWQVYSQVMERSGIEVKPADATIS